MKGSNPMKIKNLGSNMTEVTFANGDHILISYQTPVAGQIDGVLCRTSTKWSSTTSRHINKYFEMEWGIDPKVYPVEEVSQDVFTLAMDC
jgi:hypothetical protein